jgi:hypothetical protein
MISQRAETRTWYRYKVLFNVYGVAQRVNKGAVTTGRQKCSSSKNIGIRVKPFDKLNFNYSIPFRHGVEFIFCALVVITFQPRSSSDKRQVAYQIPLRFGYLSATFLEHHFFLIIQSLPCRCHRYHPLPVFIPSWFCRHLKELIASYLPNFVIRLHLPKTLESMLNDRCDC